MVDFTSILKACGDVETSKISDLPLVTALTGEPSDGQSWTTLTLRGPDALVVVVHPHLVFAA